MFLAAYGKAGCFTAPSSEVRIIQTLAEHVQRMEFVLPDAPNLAHTVIAQFGTLVGEQSPPGPKSLGLLGKQPYKRFDLSRIPFLRVRLNEAWMK